MNFASAFTPEKLQEAWECLLNEFPFAMWETLYSTLLATFFAIVIGLPLGVILVTGESKGIRPLPAPVMSFLNVLINLLRSVPFIILMVMIIPLTRLIIGTSVGNPNIIEAAQSMGASTLQIVTRVMLPESVPSLITNFTLAITTIMGYTAMSGAVGGGGLGKLALAYGYQRYRFAVLYLAVIVLVIITQVIQSFGTWLARQCDKRLKEK